MPTYVYRREDGSTFEIEQRITESALEECPTTGQRVQRVISGAGLIFKGSGFYLTDYARNGNGKSEKNGSESSNGKTETPKAEKSTEKPAEKTTAAKSD